MQDAAGQPSAQQKDLAIPSFVLGLLSVFCFAVLFGRALINVGTVALLFLFWLALPSGLAAILGGHVAHHRARRSPGQYGGSGFAIAGFVMGYFGLAILLAMLLQGMAEARAYVQSMQCTNNMKQIGHAFRTWSRDHDGNFPFNVSTNKGGTMELCRPGSDGFDRNAAFHFQVMSNELSTPFILVCPSVSKKHPALNFQNLRPENVSYLVRSGTNINETNPNEVLAVCPIHHWVLLSDGSVQRGK